MNGATIAELRTIADLLRLAAANLDQALIERDSARMCHEQQGRNTLAFAREVEECKALLNRWRALDPLKVPELLADTRKVLGL